MKKFLAYSVLASVLLFTGCSQKSTEMNEAKMNKTEKSSESNLDAMNANNMDKDSMSDSESMTADAIKNLLIDVVYFDFDKFTLNEEELVLLQNVFSAVNSDDDYGLNIIKEASLEGYLMDPHTATCFKAYENLKEKKLKTVMYSTAEWTKFSPTVLNALKSDDVQYSDKEALDEISASFNIKITDSIKDLFDSEVIHKSVINKDEIEKEIINFIK